MSLIALVVALALTLGLSAYNVELSERSISRTRAQLAADSAALAAVAESAPYGSGDVEGVARSFATANGANLAECLCSPGSTAVQVEVSMDGMTARARAVVDPSLLMQGVTAFDARGLDPRLELAVDELVAAARGQVRLVSGWRSYEQQAALWRAALEKYGSPELADDWVARPGTSMHERGLAVDLGGDIGLALQLIKQLGLPLRRTLSNEPWHFELNGVGIGP
ncbi:MAG: zinc D-Ala-D-Ala carboxypeptidase [Actinomycetota bacterium]|nr:zinc D-Ala-D-Ala carboxypeptidase [Actinomycetota bacterium]